MNLTFRKADAADLELLVKNRIEVLRAANGLSGDTDMSLVEQESRDYYRHASNMADMSHCWFMTAIRLPAAEG